MKAEARETKKIVTAEECKVQLMKDLNLSSVYSDNDEHTRGQGVLGWNTNYNTVAQEC